MTDLPGLLGARATSAVPAGYLDARRVADNVVPAGWWRRLVFKPDRPHGTVDRAAYVFCVLEQFHRRLLWRDIYASRGQGIVGTENRSKRLRDRRGPASSAVGIRLDGSSR